jgi:hypothetical protein
MTYSWAKQIYSEVGEDKERAPDQGEGSALSLQ